MNFIGRVMKAQGHKHSGFISAPLPDAGGWWRPNAVKTIIDGEHAAGERGGMR